MWSLVGFGTKDSHTVKVSHGSPKEIISWLGNELKALSFLVTGDCLRAREDWRWALFFGVKFWKG